MVLAFFLNAAIDQPARSTSGSTVSKPMWNGSSRPGGTTGDLRPAYRGDLPEGNDGLGLLLLGCTGDEVLDAPTYDRLAAEALSQVRGTVQADILKEDQAQNTCIFSTEFALRLMGDVQAYFIAPACPNFYSVSISGYHIAEAGANPITQLAFTLANGFTFVEYYLSRGMNIDDFAPNLSFFFSNGIDPEYAVIGRVARRIWAKAIKERYGADGAQPEAQVPHPDERSVPARPGDRLQRHPHDAAGALRAVRQLQQPAHQRLRRGDHDPHRGVRAPGPRHPADHQQGARPLQEREPLPGAFIVEELTDLVEEAVMCPATTRAGPLKHTGGGGAGCRPDHSGGARQPVRGADDRCQVLLPGPTDRSHVRGGRCVPPQHVTLPRGRFPLVRSAIDEHRAHVQLRPARGHPCPGRAAVRTFPCPHGRGTALPRSHSWPPVPLTRMAPPRSWPRHRKSARGTGFSSASTSPTTPSACPVRLSRSPARHPVSATPLP